MNRPMNATLRQELERSAMRRQIEKALPAPLPEPDERVRIRVSAGVSQRALADVIGVTGVACHRYEHGQRTPRGETRRRYAEALAMLREMAR